MEKLQQAAHNRAAPDGRLTPDTHMDDLAVMDEVLTSLKALESEVREYCERQTFGPAATLVAGETSRQCENVRRRLEHWEPLSESPEGRVKMAAILAQVAGDAAYDQLKSLFVLLQAIQRLE